MLRPESTHRVQTSIKEYVLVCNLKLIHNIQLRLITKIVRITVLTPRNNSKVALFDILQMLQYEK